MTPHSILNLNLYNSQVNKLKSGIKNETSNFKSFIKRYR